MWYGVSDISNRLIQGYKLCLDTTSEGGGVAATAAPDLLIYGQRCMGMTSFLSQRYSYGELGDVFRLLQGFQLPGSAGRAGSCLAIRTANAEVTCAACTQ